MIIKSFGCSFVWGSELSDINFKNKKFSMLTWPALIAKKNQADYKCYARPGAGNFYILQSLLNQLQDPCDLYIINWTFHGRFDYVFAHGEKTPTSWHSILPWDTNDRAKFYYQNFHSEFTDKLQNLIWVSLAVTALKEANAKFCMTYMDNLLFDNRWNGTPATHNLQEKIKPYMNQFDGLNFLEWSQKNQYPIGTIGNHPLEQAHAAAAEYLEHHNLV
jgi:hypothetical protein